MKIEFVLESEHRVGILTVLGDGRRKKIGHIFTDKHLQRDKSIQICGFSEAFDLWGCALFAVSDYSGQYGRLHSSSHVQQKDIQLMFNPKSRVHKTDVDIVDECTRCYNNPCTCESKIPRNCPYTVKRKADLFGKKEKSKEPNKRKVGRGIEILAQK